jgi:hypothetical protein
LANSAGSRILGTKMAVGSRMAAELGARSLLVNLIIKDGSVIDIIVSKKDM